MERLPDFAAKAKCGMLINIIIRTVDAVPETVKRCCLIFPPSRD
jgi:hypothetical protein